MGRSLACVLAFTGVLVFSAPAAAGSIGDPLDCQDKQNVCFDTKCDRSNPNQAAYSACLDSSGCMETHKRCIEMEQQGASRASRSSTSVAGMSNSSGDKTTRVATHCVHDVGGKLQNDCGYEVSAMFCRTGADWSHAATTPMDCTRSEHGYHVGTWYLGVGETNEPPGSGGMIQWVACERPGRPNRPIYSGGKLRMQNCIIG